MQSGLVRVVASSSEDADPGTEQDPSAYRPTLPWDRENAQVPWDQISDDPPPTVREGDPLIVASARRGDADSIRALIAAGACVDETREGGASALYIASQYGHLAAVNALIAAGASLNLQTDEPDPPTEGDEGGSTPLQAAAHNDHLDVMVALLDAGAAISQEAANGSTALLLAAQRGSARVLSLLIARGVSLNLDRELHPEQTSVIYFASQNGHTEAVRLLAAAGANVDDGGGEQVYIKPHGKTDVI